MAEMKLRIAERHMDEYEEFDREDKVGQDLEK